MTLLTLPFLASLILYKITEITRLSDVRRDIRSWTKFDRSEQNYRQINVLIVPWSADKRTHSTWYKPFATQEKIDELFGSICHRA